MPGAFAHFTMVNTLLDTAVLDAIPNLSKSTKHALMTHSRFCDLGAVGPDYPYLDVAHSNSQGRANVMHYWQTTDFIRRAVDHLCETYPPGDNTDAREKCIAWIFGYTAHVVTDMSVHPVVQMKVGPYQQNAGRHRICEMNQDVYIADKLLGLTVSIAEYSEIIKHCSDPTTRWTMDSAVAALWIKILADIQIGDVHLADGIDVPVDAPAPDRWHTCFTTLIDAAENGVVPFISRFTKGYLYPRLDQIDRDYIDNLQSPTGTPIKYDEVFQRAQEAVKGAWGDLGAAIENRDSGRFTLANGVWVLPAKHSGENSTEAKLQSLAHAVNTPPVRTSA